MRDRQNKSGHKYRPASVRRPVSFSNRFAHYILLQKVNQEEEEEEDEKCRFVHIFHL